MNWFNVDKKGLAKLMAGKSKAFVLYELLPKRLGPEGDESRCHDYAGQRRANDGDRVEDNDPEGFADLAHAYTLFAESDKKSDAKKRGRFNIGEKLVLAWPVKQPSRPNRRGAV